MKGLFIAVALVLGVLCAGMLSAQEIPDPPNVKLTPLKFEPHTVVIPITADVARVVNDLPAEEGGRLVPLDASELPDAPEQVPVQKKEVQAPVQNQVPQKSYGTRYTGERGLPRLRGGGRFGGRVRGLCGGIFGSCG